MPRADFSQFEHFGDMRDHYQLHVEEAKENQEIFTFWDFVYLHFLSPDEHSHSNHGDDHRNLPLQIVSSSMGFIIGLIIDLGEENRYPDQNAIYKNVFHLEGFLPSIFHPPFIG